MSIQITVDNVQTIITLTIWFTKEIPYLSLSAKKSLISSREIEADIELALGDAPNIDEAALKRFQAFWLDYKKCTNDSACLTCRNNGYIFTGARMTALLERHGFIAADIFGQIDKNIVWNDRREPVRRGTIGCVDAREFLEALLTSCLLK